MTLNVVDSSAWLEYLTDSPAAQHFVTVIEDTEKLVIPTVCLYEVFKKVLRERGEGDALAVASLMQAGRVVDLDPSLALEAARLPLPLVDSWIYATAQRYKATLWTRDEHFKALPGVRYFKK